MMRIKIMKKLQSVEMVEYVSWLQLSDIPVVRAVEELVRTQNLSDKLKKLTMNKL